ncbi:Protein of unknown function [Cotesia congregata]|uniref:Uncharacterized protein n=1 Tax=Cotesia congregata TaxID=51543 RepID=A0A8J2HH94_COTCN|nr:Protein of unknown function [Cotesia congregata]
MTDNQIEILRIHELDARLSIGCAFLILHYYITYIERCKAAQFALDDNPDVGKFQYYLKLRSRHKKSIRELLSLEDKDVITIKERTYYFMDQA